MTDLARGNCPIPRLSGAFENQNVQLQSLSVEKRTSTSNDRFIVLTNTKTRRSPNICVFVNKSESQGFVHRSHISRSCNEQSIANNEIKSRKYFTLLKDYVNVVLATKRLTSELEGLLEQCHEDKQAETSTSWDISKVLNVLERYKTDTKIIKGLEIRLKSFLKSEMPFIAHSIAINVQGLQNFLYCSHNEVLVNIQQILQKEIKTLHSYDSEILLRNDSVQRTNLGHFSQLAGKFEKLAFDVLAEFEQWCFRWRGSTLGIVSKKRGLRSRSPFVYLTHLPLPHKVHCLDQWIKSMSISEYLEQITRERSIKVSNKIVSCLFNLVFKEEKSPGINGVMQNGSGEINNSDRAVSLKEKKNSIKKTRNTLFQEFWQIGSQEAPLLAEIIKDMFHYHSKTLKTNFDLQNNNKSNQVFVKNEQSERMNNGQLTSLSIDRSPSLAKKVHWGSVKDVKIQKKIEDSYIQLLWKELARNFVKNLLFGNITAGNEPETMNLPLACMDGESMSIVTSCSLVKKLKSATGEIEPVFLKCVKAISLNVMCYVYIQKWDYAFCNAQAKSIRDKCRIANNTSPKHSETMGLIVRALSAIQDIIELFTVNGSWFTSTMAESKHENTWALLNCLLSFTATLQMSVDWLQNKSQHFVSSGSWEQFHVITSHDASALQEKLRLIIPHFAILSKNIHCSENPDSSLLQTLEMIQSLIANIKMFNLTKIDVLVQAIKIRADASISHAFPPAKQWRKRGATRLPFDANLYVKLTAHQVLAPVIESVKCIVKEDADEIIFRCCSAFVTSIMDYILEEGIRFSFFGAHQLRLDFTFLKEWIGQDALHLPNETVSKILTLPSFGDMDSAITLLCCQPEHRHRSSLGESETNSSMISSSSTGSLSGSLYEDIIKEIELRHKDQWLALRVKGGQTKSKLLCISMP